MRLRLFVLFFVIASGLTVPSGVHPQDNAQTQWLKMAQLGPYTPAKEDWKAIETAARKEGKVVFLSGSSRISEIQKPFKDKYGIELEAYDMLSLDQIEKFSREYQSGLHKTDLLLCNAGGALAGELLPKKMIWKYVPEDLKSLLDEDALEPFLVQRWSTRTFIYNPVLNPKGAPIDNIWDVTRKEWKDKVLTLPPTDSGMVNFFQTVLNHPKELAAAYEKKFGTPIKLSPGIKNAAEEWIVRFFKTAVISPSSTKIVKSVMEVKQKEAPIGITSWSLLRMEEKGVYVGAPIYDMKPVFGVSYPAFFVVCDQAPHPNATKLLIRYMLTEGFGPWDTIGEIPPLKDLQAKMVKKYNIPANYNKNLWLSDDIYNYKTSYDYMQFALTLGK